MYLYIFQLSLISITIAIFKNHKSFIVLSNKIYLSTPSLSLSLSHAFFPNQFGNISSLYFFMIYIFIFHTSPEIIVQ